MKDFEKHLRIKSSAIKTWRFGDDMSPLSIIKCKLFNNLLRARVFYEQIVNEAQWLVENEGE